MPRLLRAFRLMRLAASMPFKGEILSLLGIAQMIAIVVMLGHWIGCIWFLLQRVQSSGPEAKTWLSENDYTDEFGNTTITFPESYTVSFSAALYMLVGATDGACESNGIRTHAATNQVVPSRWLTLAYNKAKRLSISLFDSTFLRGGWKRGTVDSSLKGVGPNLEGLACVFQNAHFFRI